MIPSIRLKAYRRGQQDVEYLTLWSLLHKEPRWAVGRQVRAALNLAGTHQATGLDVAEDAGRIDYARFRPQDLWALRTRIGEALSLAHPRPRESSSTSAPRAGIRSTCRRPRSPSAPSPDIAPDRCSDTEKEAGIGPVRRERPRGDVGRDGLPPVIAPRA